MTIVWVALAFTAGWFGSRKFGQRLVLMAFNKDSWTRDVLGRLAYDSLVSLRRNLDAELAHRQSPVEDR